MQQGGSIDQKILEDAGEGIKMFLDLNQWEEAALIVAKDPIASEPEIVFDRDAVFARESSSAVGLGDAIWKIERCKVFLCEVAIENADMACILARQQAGRARASETACCAIADGCEGKPARSICAWRKEYPIHQQLQLLGVLVEQGRARDCLFLARFCGRSRFWRSIALFGEIEQVVASTHGREFLLASRVRLQLLIRRLGLGLLASRAASTGVPRYRTISSGVRKDGSSRSIVNATGTLMVNPTRSMRSSERAGERTGIRGTEGCSAMAMFTMPRRSRASFMRASSRLRT